MRPTADRARQALFDILAHGSFVSGGAPFQGERVVDAFAGTGALGLEALSRGAEEAAFIERDPAALAALRRNLAALGEEGRARIFAGDATRPPPAPFSCAIAFLDPPYGSGLAGPALAALAKAGWLKPSAIAVVELRAREEFVPPAGFALAEERIHGAARLIFLRLSASSGAAAEGGVFCR